MFAFESNKLRIIQVSFARPSLDSIKFANLYICGIPKQWTIKELEAYFNSSGNIITSRILTDTNTGFIFWRSFFFFCRNIKDHLLTRCFHMILLFYFISGFFCSSLFGVNQIFQSLHFKSPTFDDSAGAREFICWFWLYYFVENSLQS